MWDRALRETGFTGVNFEVGDYKEPGSCLHQGQRGRARPVLHPRHLRDHRILYSQALSSVLCNPPPPREDWPASGRHKPFSVSLPTHPGQNLSFRTFRLGQDPYRFKRNHRSPVSYSIIGQPPYARTKSMPHASDLLRHRREIQPRQNTYIKAWVGQRIPSKDRSGIMRYRMIQGETVA